MHDHDPIGEVHGERGADGLGGRWYGVYPATVSDVKDPNGQGRVKVKLPWAADSKSSQYEAWARLSTAMAGSKKGTWLIPDADDEVLVSFEAGDPRRPYVIGSLWNGKDSPPESMDGAGKNYTKVLCSRNGVKITLDDHQGQEKLILETPGGNKVTLKDGGAAITLEDSNGNSVKLESSALSITAASSFTIDAPSVSISAGQVSIDSANVQCSGIVQSTTHITSTQVASTYTPGAGNIL